MLKRISCALVVACASLALAEEPAAPADPSAAVEALIAGGQYAEAEAAARALLASAELADGPESLAAARAMDALAESLYYAGKESDPEAKRLAERALAITVEALGPEHLEVASRLNTLATIALGAGDLDGARSVFERALALREKALPPQHPDLAASINNLASVVHDLGDHAAARPLYERAIAIYEGALGPEHPYVAAGLNNLALLLRDMGDYAAAKPLYERALAIREKADGPDHPGVAASLANLAEVLQDMSELEGARALHERSVAIREKALGPEHPSLARGLTNLGGLRAEMGDHAAALPLYERAVSIFEKALGPDHPDVATALSNLAAFHHAIGDHASARSLFERALVIREKALGPDHFVVASTLNSLATLLDERSDYGAARPLYERALAIREKALGPEHPATAWSLSSLALLLHDLGDHATALSLFERTLAIDEKVLGPEHVEVSVVLGHLGALALDMGDLARARTLFDRSRTVREKALGPAHPEVAKAWSNLAIVDCATGQSRLALAEALRAEAIARDHARLTFRALSERQALGLGASRAGGLNIVRSIVAAGHEPAERARVWDAVMRSRTLVLDEMAARHAAGAAGPAARELASASRRLADLAVRGPGSASVESYRQALEEATRQKEVAERELAAQSASFRASQSRWRLGFDDVAQALPRGTALVAYSAFDQRPVGERLVQRHLDGPKPVPSYLAFVLLGGAARPEVVSLGVAAEVDALVARAREEVARPDGGREANEALRARAWDPVAAVIGDAKRVYLVPDGALNLVSFSALPTADGRHLVETGPTLHYLSAERDLVPSTELPTSGTGLLALGGASFDDERLFAKLAPVANAGPTLVATTASSFRGQRSACGDFATLRFAPLRGTEREAGEVVALWGAQADGRTPTVIHLSGQSASEAEFKRAAAGRRVLHLATHGFFLGGDCAAPAASTRGVSAAPQAAPIAPVHAENPLLLSGLALAGANHREAAGPDEEDGILTAEEIASLDLSAAEWAVLSACDTGLGDVRAGEGVFGLRRAFQVAGAKTVIMSLWSVDDDATREWMRELYRARLERKLDTAECVREASLAVVTARRERGESTHPFYWAGFVAAGDWR